MFIGDGGAAARQGRTGRGPGSTAALRRPQDQEESGSLEEGSTEVPEA